jgi:XTP/dITP diphosphohydrolase
MSPGTYFKVEENRILGRYASLNDGTAVHDLFEFDIRKVPVKEVLDVDIEAMVRAEVQSAYEKLRVPCIVEHAGLIFEDHLSVSYPGGLTKAMWDALGTEFVNETRSAGRSAIARAVVGYCDGSKVHTFVGETKGRIADSPRAGPEFYWDTVFIPDIAGESNSLTYSELVANRGLQFKVLTVSQSTRAMIEFLEYRRSQAPALWPPG